MLRNASLRSFVVSRSPAFPKKNGWKKFAMAAAPAITKNMPIQNSASWRSFTGSDWNNVFIIAENTMANACACMKTSRSTSA